MDENHFTQEEITALRRMLREDEAKRRHAAQERAAILTKAFQAQYGPLHRTRG